MRQHYWRRSMTTALRPMTTGELLDRSFSLYRNNFFLFAGIALLPPVLTLMLDAVRTSLFQKPAMGVVNGTLQLAPASYGPLALVLLLGYFLGFVLSSGATVHAVSTVYLGKSAGIGESYRAIQSAFGRLIGLFLLICLIFAGFGIGIVVVIALLAGAFVATTHSQGAAVIFLLVTILPATVLFIHLYVCMSLSTAACVVEKTGATDSLRRSFRLSKGARGKIWLIMLLFFTLIVVLSFSVVIPSQMILARSGPPWIANVTASVLQFLVSVFVGPVLTVSLILAYYDQRVRKEAFDLQHMMESIGATAAEPLHFAAPPPSG
jgi:hypothetical protein